MTSLNWVANWRGDPMPHHMSLWVAVQQHQRWSLTADAGEDAPAAGGDPLGSEAGEQIDKV